MRARRECLARRLYLDFVDALGVRDTRRWRWTFLRMAKEARQTSLRPRHLRAATREKLNRITELLAEAAALLGDDAVVIALRAAPSPEHDRDLAALQRLIARTRTAAAAIPHGRGARDLGADFADYSAEDLCAACVFQAWRAVHGTKPAANSERAQAACAALWRAATRENPHDPLARWPRHLRDVRSRADAATVAARLRARDLLKRSELD